MLRKLVDFQRIFWQGPATMELNQIILGVVLAVISSALAFYSMSIVPFVIVAGLWLLNHMHNSSAAFVQLLPVSRSFVALNLYLSSLLLTLLVLGTIAVSLLAANGLVYIALSLTVPKGIYALPGHLSRMLAIAIPPLPLWPLVLILLALGTTTVFLRRPLRNIIFAALFILANGLLIVQRMAIPYPERRWLSLAQGLALVQGIDRFYLFTGLAAFVIVPLCVYVGWWLHISKAT